MNFLFAAYLVIWIMLSGYIFSLHKKQKELFKEIDQLKRRLESSSS